MTSAEAFLLGAAFYLHDIGMAYAATPEGLKRLQASAPYRSYMSGVPEQHRSEPASAANAVAIAVRQLHADAANELATGEIPGTSGIYIFPDKIFREAWGATCGKIASSHHWTVPDLEVHFGLHRSIPLPGGRDADLLYVAACLRLIDYAHINRDRASSLDRAFRYSLGHESLIHWLAQENVDGPLRDSADYLIYRAARPIAHVDSWWLYYEMIIGLDTEIRAVTRALDRAGSTYKQLSLRGVRGATSPEEAASYFPTSGFLPIEVNLRTGSIDKLVELLAGETLYGPNPMAAVRELIQNARDAVMLKAEIAANDVERATLALPISVTISTAGSSPYLEIIDYGIGMTKTVITDYLISIASDYWTTQFRRDFPALAMKGFKSAGKFGIGFLSVFMLGDEVSVESNRTGEERYRLSLRGVGRRGELQKVKSPTGSGTSVRVSLRKNALETLKNSRTLLPLYAPTLPHDLRIIIDGVDTVLKDGWVASISCDDLRKWTAEAERVLTRQMNVRSRSDSDGFDELYMRRRYFLASYDGSKKSNIWKVRWPEYVNGRTRLIASLSPYESISILCLRGLAVQPVTTPGFLGVIELDSITTDAGRSRAISADINPILSAARAEMTPSIIENLEEMSQHSFIVDTISTIASCVQWYGPDVVLKSRVNWIHRITAPGDIQIISCATLLLEASRLSSVFMTFNIGPWTAIRRWADAEGPRDANEIAIALDDAGQPAPGYLSGDDKKKIGSLDVIWKESERSALFSTLIAIIAQAWQLSPADLLKQAGWTHERNWVYGRFARN